MDTTANPSALEIVQYYQTKNPCYKAGRRIKPTGIVVHSTGASNPYIKRYVGPDDGILGANEYGNHWNKSSATKCVHAFIGKVADGSLKVYQTLPWGYRCWGVGSGKKGSYNNSHIQFEICEDSKTNEAYYKAAFDLAIKLCAYLCKEYGIRPENVVGHYEAHAAGYGSNHGDPRNWQKRFGGSMDAFRAEVAALLGEEIVADVSSSKPTAGGSTTQQTDTPTIRKGSEGDKVREMQNLLIKAGCTLPRFGADGQCGDETVAAIKAFQTANGLTVDGVCGALTWAKLKATTGSAAQKPTESEPATTNRPTIRKGSKGDVVREMQTLLVKAGCTLPRYGIDGDCGSETVEAIKAFQTANSLTPDGICGPLTWAKLDKV